MAASTEIEEQVSAKLKLLVRKDNNKVIFGEAGKDFVDILCSFLTLPLGTIARLLEKETDSHFWSLNSLYQSVKHIDEECLRSVTCKEMLLQPRNSSENYCSNHKLNIDNTEPKNYFMCANLYSCNYGLLSTFRNQRCECGSLLIRSVLLESGEVYNGFLKDAPNFIITDDLTIMPNSMDISLNLLRKFGVKNTSSLKEMTVNVTQKQVLDLLKYSLLSKSPLTDLFLSNGLSLKSESFTPCRKILNNSSSIQIKVKLFLRKTDSEILFAQGEEDFADFLFSLLTFPLGAVVNILGGNSSLKSIDGLYKSITNLDGEKYLMSNEVKNRLLYPTIASQFNISKQILQISEPSASSYYC